MIKDITLGQYFPGDSLIHRLDPRTKIILTLVFIVSIFLAKSAASYVFILIALLFLALFSSIPFPVVLKGMKPILWIILFTSIINVFWTKGDHLIFSFWRIEIYLEGILNMLYMIVRIVSLLSGTGLLLTYTTTPISLTNGIEPMLSPLKKIKVPVHEFVMMLTIALRFIPTLVEETDKIMNAQKARGSDFSSGSLKKRVSSLVPVFIPLFVSAFRRADELATAMECRCYHGGEGRTKMKTPRFQRIDLIAFFSALIFPAGIILLNVFVPFGAI